MRKRSVFITVLSIACFAAIAILICYQIILRPWPSVPATTIASNDPAQDESVHTQLESVEEPSAAAGRSTGAPPPATPVSSADWRVEMQNSPLRAKMREYARVEKWEEKYAPYKDEALRAERDAIDEQILELVKPEMERRLSRGAYEVVSTTGVYTGPSYNTCEVYWIFGDGKTSKRVTLPQAGYEDVYKLKALSTWLFEYEAGRPALAATK